MRSVFRSVGAVVLVLAGLWLTAVGGAAAGNPDRQALPAPPDVSVACPQGFSATAHAAINGEYISTFTMPDGTTRLQIEGRFVTTVTGNGRTLTLATAGLRPSTSTLTVRSRSSTAARSSTLRRTSAGSGSTTARSWSMQTRGSCSATRVP